MNWFFFSFFISYLTFYQTHHMKYIYKSYGNTCVCCLSNVGVHVLISIRSIGYGWIHVGWIHATHGSATYKVEFGQFWPLHCNRLQPTPPNLVWISLSPYIYTCIYIFVYVIFSFRHFFSCRTDVWEIRKFKRKICFVCLHVIWIKEVCCIRAGELILYTSVRVL